MKSTLRKSADPRSVRADLLVVCVPKPPGALAGPAAAVDEALGGLVGRVVSDGEVDGAPGSAAVIHVGAGLAAKRVAVVGIGSGSRDD